MLSQRAFAPATSMNMVIIFWVVVAIIVFVRFRIKMRQFRIESPRLGMLDLTRGQADGFIAEDQAAFAELFASTSTSTDAVPKCDVLFIYATLGEGDSFLGTDRHLRGEIRDSGAKIVVLASDNPNPNTGKPGLDDARANLVITLRRNGDKFPQFYRKLFTKMKRGRSMPMAWVSLVPQVPGLTHVDCPDCFFIQEAGPISFR